MHQGTVQRLRVLLSGRRRSTYLAKKFDFADRVAGCLHATMGRMRIHTSVYMYTSYMIVYASTFRSIMLLLWRYDVLRCPFKCTSCTYYIVVLHVYTFPPVACDSPSPLVPLYTSTPTANYSPSTVDVAASKCSASAQIMIQ